MIYKFAKHAYYAFRWRVSAMLKSRILPVCNLSLVLLMSCSVLENAGAIDDVFTEKEKKLGTHGKSKQIYHEVVKDPLSIKLDYEGFLIGIEKSENSRIGAPEVLDASRFRFRDNSPGSEARRQLLERVSDDGKTMFVSHLVAYDISQNNGQPVQPRFIHNVYPTPDFPVKSDCGSILKADEYEQGWEAMSLLRCEIERKRSAAHEEIRPYTHLVIMSMGWNNDQKESVRRYNIITKQLIEAAREDGENDFRLLLVTLSWPSVWASESLSYIKKKVLHITSYGNKCDDADEIGFTIANKLVNDIALDIKHRAAANGDPLKIVLIGHSMGARLMTRAVFSRDLLTSGHPQNGEKVELVMGLQGAFSINRFVDGHLLKFPLNLFRKGEGYPYAGYADTAGKFIMSWSENDKANPFSVLLTG